MAHLVGRNRWYFLLPLLLFLAMGIFQLGQMPSVTARGNLTQDEFARIHSVALDSLVEDSNAWFMTAGVCAQCHGNDTAGLAMVDAMGNDVNFTDDWRATMMANSARDPFWRAQVSHEGITAPGQMTAIEDECATCHAPLGRYSHEYQTGQEFAMSQIDGDPLSLDGVTCMACHSLPGDSLGATFSGQFKLDTNRLAYGPFPGPFDNPMVDSIGIVPAYGPHIQDAELCASCHTLITETLDLQGNPTGQSFVEQATYHEWLNSGYPGQGTTCQSCHVPELPGGAIVSAHYPGTLFPRGYGLHQFAGANIFMLRMMKANRDSLAIPADAVHFDSVIARTERMLQQKTLSLDLELEGRTTDTAAFSLQLNNLAGHKFPSGYPSRRAFVEFVVRKQNGDTLFKSGLLGSDYELEGQDQGYEPHHNQINDPDQVQIYELVMGDVASNVTTTLRRGSFALKDNRLVPQGFSSMHTTYDTTKIAGTALNDPNFNRENGLEGSGSDRIFYRVALNGYADSLNVSARVWYQTVRPEWLAEMFANNSAAIDRFRDMYSGSDKAPVLIGEVIEQGIVVSSMEPQPLKVEVWPNPSPHGLVYLRAATGSEILAIEVLDAQGKMLTSQRPKAIDLQEVRLGNSAGTYWVRVRTEIGSISRKVIRLK